MRKIAIYCRVSTDEQARNKEGSIASQVQRLQLKTDEKNRNNGIKKWGKVVHIYKDEAYSGKNTNRPELQKMLSDVKSKRIDTVMVTELSRLSRSVTDFLNFVQELEEYGCDFICLQYDFDTTSPAGKVFMTIIMALAQFERELTAERIKNNFHARALRGLSNGGTPFLGYDKDPSQSGKLIVNKKEAIIVKDIFDFYLEAEGLAQVAHHFNDRGLKNKTWISKMGKPCGGQPFNTDAIWRALTNYAYIGKREVNKANKGLDQYSLKTEQRYSIVDASWEAIIDPEMFNKVKGKLCANKKVKHKVTYDFILSGLLVCDECGGSLCGQSATSLKRKHFYYGHTKKTNCRIQRYNAKELERLVKKQLFSLLNNEAMKGQFIDALVTQTKCQPKVAKILLETQKKEIEKLKLETEKLAHLIMKNPLAKGLETFLVKVRENEEKLKKAEQEKQKLEEKALFEVESNVIDASFIFSNIDKLRKSNFRKAKISKKRAIVGELIKSIHVHPQNVIRLDLWASESQSANMEKEELKTSGVVLPFHKLGKPLEASFRDNVSCGNRFSEARKEVGLGTYVLSPHHYCNDHGKNHFAVAGSPSVAFGDRGRTRTSDPQLRRLLLYPTELRDPQHHL